MTNFNNLKFIDGDFLTSDSLSEMIYENEGSFTQKDQSITFTTDNNEITINFDVYVEGSISEDSGDYYTPSSCDIELTDLDISIRDVIINGSISNVDYQTLSKFEKLIKLQLS